MSLERDLREALRRQDPPAGFGDRVRARLTSSPDSGSLTRRSRSRLAWPVAASLLLAAAGGYYVQERAHQRQLERVAAEQAAREVTLALQVTSEKLAAVRTRVQELNRHDH